MDKAGSPVSELLMDSQKDELLASETIAIEIESGFVGIKPVSGQARNEIDKGEAMEVSESQLEWVKNAKMRFDYEMSIFRFSSLSAAVRDKIMGVLRACSEVRRFIVYHSVPRKSLKFHSSITCRPFVIMLEFQ
eukprot:Gregarina_sp_Poly_1__4476@NODE_2407_length_2171_cov_123_598859_g8_i3_p2_GENE_NODE_2407_length_2171_cov_123_598859_g8_i3NODE_2407_length_2171_cov_123_598859_g8_i3_p2_ORF_typecomplete_len134_score24_35_NODE_2407_length_2171_cov_123_598859_g8_i3353754